MIDPGIDFHRNAIALVPSADDRHPGVAFYVDGNPSQQFCNCRHSGKKTCAHLKALFNALGAKGTPAKGLDLEADFRKSVWHDLATVLSQDGRLSVQDAKTQFYRNADQTTLQVLSPDGKVVIAYGSSDGNRQRFADRLGAFSSDEDDRVPDRAEIIRRLRLLTMSEAERQLHELGIKSRRQAFEDSLWFRLAYHCFLEFGSDDCRFHPSVNEASGAFIVTCKNRDGETIFHATIARNRVHPLLDCLGHHLPNQHDLPIHPIPLKSLFRISQSTETDLDVYPVIQVLQNEGERRFFSREGLERYIYGDLVYIPELQILAVLEKPGRARRFVAPRRMTFKRYQIPSFLESVGDEIDGDGFVIDPDVGKLKLLRRWNTMTLTPTTVERDWCWLSVTYGFGDASVSLAEILNARQESSRYIGTPGGWVDTQSPTMEAVGDLAAALPPGRFSPEGDRLKLKPQELFRLLAVEPTPPTIVGTEASAGRLSSMLTMEPSAPPRDPGLASTLRPYQNTGLNWLWWLWENRLGGLLCDDMGLGKTHQVMALMACIRRREKEKKPFLVVCPTTVLSHWALKLEQHATSLKAAAYYGADRNLSTALGDADVLVTSYGLLLRDIDRLKSIPFCLAIFDEIQQIKNAATKTNAAATALETVVKIGLTGTPIENSIMELKALMDIVAPGYLGSERIFYERFSPDAAADRTAVQDRDQLRRLIHPFTLRRLKRGVLKELPEKIEDIRYCELSDQQVKLYRDAIDSRAKGIVSALADENESIPYIHIFALLTLLKQICNHPALIDKPSLTAEEPSSGKWELFAELLQESLESGQKVVVYSQFTTMLTIITEHLNRQGIDHVVLTGTSRHRGRLIERFNSDPACRVFVGSLKAGGTGIDLVAASVVIHYDRWWNAAKEDQATDRVHRIGQRRGVQVFKLVTLGTLEEKISAMIEKKRKLMADIVREDDPGLLKSFSRQELLDFLS